jgi:hypothetical protein
MGEVVGEVAEFKLAAVKVTHIEKPGFELLNTFSTTEGCLALEKVWL